MLLKKSTPLLAAILLIACGEKENTDLIQSYFEVHNSHDVEKALSYFSEEAVFELKGVWTKKGLIELRGLEEFDAAMNSHLELKDMRESGDTIYCKVVENNDWFGNMGITDLVHDPVIMVVRDQKINHIIGFPNQETGQEIEAAIEGVFQWSQMHGDSTIYKLLPNGKFQYSNEAGAQWKALFKKMKAKDSVP